MKSLPCIKANTANMTKDIQYIIEHKCSKTEFFEYFSLAWTLFCSIPFAIIGYSLLFYSNSFDFRILGLFLGVGITGLVIHVIYQFKRLNKFESIKLMEIHKPISAL